MFFYLVSLMCTVAPCAQVINTEGSITPAVISGDVIPIAHDPVYVVPALTGSYSTVLSNDSKTGRSFFSSSHKNKFIINELLHNVPAQDEPATFNKHNFSNFHLPDSGNPIVQTKDGMLRGFIMKTINSRPFAAFQGVPFAQPPVGPLRFKAPEKNLPWNGVRDAIAPSPECVQADYIKQYQVHGEEDCLYLSVYTPSLTSHKKKLLPVMVFIHGGGFFFGSSSIYGPAYFLDHDVVLVTLNYRIGALGFLSTGDEASPGNNGLKDQSLALKWVAQNIAHFGGDPSSVTIFGESAGASSVQFHFLSPLSRGLFHRGISQSGCATCFWSIDERAPETAKKFGSFLNCTGSSTEMVECLRTKDAAQLASTHLFLLEWLMYPVVVFGPVVEPEGTPGAFLTQQPEQVYREKKAAKVPWISGYNSDEGAINIAVLFLDNATLPQLNNEWEKYGPIFLAMKELGEETSVEVVNKVREFYLGDKEISFENRKDAIDMFGDRYSIACGLKAMRYHSLYTGQPVYAYQLSYNGKYSIVQLLGQNSKDWGVSHLDDLVYQFNNTVYYPELKLGDEEHQLSKIMNNIWSNFATFGKPYLTKDGKLQEIWEPIERSQGLDSPLQFLDLNLNPEMIKDPFAKRDKFWRDLAIPE